MKKILVLSSLIVTALLFSGCVTDGVYDKSKPFYKAVESVAPIIPMSDATKGKLQKIDKYATAYDEAREIVKGSLNEKKSDADTSKALNQSSSVGGNEIKKEKR